MKRRTTQRLGAVLAAVLAASALGVATAAAEPRDTLGWRDCSPPSGDRQCATLPVPLDYADPGGRQIELAVSRAAATGTRRGVLVLIPGGPGNSGLDLLSGIEQSLPPQVRDRYDVVSFDPRGVGQSSPVSCGLQPDDLANALPWPAPNGDISANVTHAQRIAQDCARNGGPVLRSISTRNEARDIDRMRTALGVDRISYWAQSYGTYVGAVYATMFAEHTDRVVLDSNNDPDPARVERGWSANRAIGVEDRFPDFAAWAAAPENRTGLGDNPQVVRKTFLDVAARLDHDPLPWPSANLPVLTGNVLRQTVMQRLSSDHDFGALAALLRAARDRTTLPPAAAVPVEAMQNVIAVGMGTLCDDVAWPRDVAGYARDVAANRARYPLTAGMPVNISPCAFWPAPAEPPVTITSAGPSNVLLVQGLRDQNSPYVGALAARRAFGDRARMVTEDVGGHVMYLTNGNACGNRVVTDFLATGRRPAQDVICRRDG